MSTTRGLLIGRFQPFHNGHQQLVSKITSDLDELVVAIGSAGDSHTVRNPFTAGERIMMVTKTLESLDITTYAVPVEDLNRNSVWVSHLQSMSPHFDVAYSNNPLVIRLLNESGIQVRQTEMFDRDALKGSEIRKLMVRDGDWQQYVPVTVEEVIEEIDGIERITQVSIVDGSS
jgi:nicotinamide-nucleotide adenylyltransferase